MHCSDGFASGSERRNGGMFHVKHLAQVTVNVSRETLVRRQSQQIRFDDSASKPYLRGDHAKL